MCLLTLLHRFNTVHWLIMLTMPSTSSVTQGARSKLTSLMVTFMISRVICVKETGFMFLFTVIRASVPKLILDDVFEQKNEIAKAVEEELEKV